MKRLLLLVSIFFITSSVFVYAFTVPSVPTGHVNDYAGMLSFEAKQSLEQGLSLFAASTTNEVVVVTVPDLGGDTIEHYANTLFTSWKIGNEKVDNGVLLLISRDDHTMRVEVGYGLEGALPDILAKDIISNVITPSFKQGNYDDGIIRGVSSIMSATKGEYHATPSSSSRRFSLSGKGLEMLLVFGFIVFQFLASVLSRSKSWWAGGVIGGVFGFILTSLGIFSISSVAGYVLIGVLVFIGLVFDYVVSSTYSSAVSSGGTIPTWVGGNSGFFSSSGGGGFGGFGGGSSGGGGASGSW